MIVYCINSPVNGSLIIMTPITAAIVHVNKRLHNEGIHIWYCESNTPKLGNVDSCSFKDNLILANEAVQVNG